MGTLQHYGKPMKALRMLDLQDYPITERMLSNQFRQRDGVYKSWHSALATLVEHGLAHRTGTRPYVFEISSKGKRKLAE